MRYEKPQVQTVSAHELLALLGPARAERYDQDESSDCYFWQAMSGKCR